jgi:hypothetical protein
MGEIPPAYSATRTSVSLRKGQAVDSIALSASALETAKGKDSQQDGQGLVHQGA